MGKKKKKLGQNVVNFEVRKNERKQSASTTIMHVGSIPAVGTSKSQEFGFFNAGYNICDEKY